MDTPEQILAERYLADWYEHYATCGRCTADGERCRVGQRKEWLADLSTEQLTQS